ncbi:hypothetical protein [Planobispora takensis]|uniref:Uncharacterized protein n=1 Tax=Planobispora takensis TaxID=1367882 RepID=A0A8J3T2M9_9ACTN|nr:hypothetical protein [Planobispora takensis]GII04131.1 hypothetical protein Pta02_61390 [Planobispora takensis]
MRHGNNITNQSKSYSHLRELVQECIGGLLDRAFAEDDARARRQGWQIIRKGTRRIYRDPRFDALQECVPCWGEGVTADERQCSSCGGTGRINLLLRQAR